MKATLNDQLEQTFRLRALTLMVGLALIAMSNQESLARSNETSAAFTATQLVRQFTLKNTVAQVNQGMQGYVAEVNGQLRSEGMGPTPTNYPVGMGSVPVTVNLPQRDGAGRPLGYCAWDNSSNTSNASFLAGLGVASPLLYAVISPGLNGAIETTCAQILVSGVGNNDDYVLTTAPTQASSRQFRSSVGTEAELFAMAGENGDVRLVTETNRLYSHLNGTWTAIGAASNFADDSAANGAGAISYTAGKVTVGDFQAGSAVITGALTAGSLLGNGSGLTDLNMSNAGSGVLSAAFGGTGVDSSAAANGQLLIGNGSGFVLGGLTAGAGIGVATGAGTITISNTGVTSIAGTLDQVIVSGTTGDITLSLPQAIGVTSSPTFGGMSLNGALAGTDASFTGAVNVGSLSVAGVPATLAFTYANSTGDPVYLDNLALGAGALAGEKRGGNVALGQLAMSSMVASANTTHGVRNTALGSVAMYFNQTGRDNVAVGEAALFGNTTGDFNTAVGRTAIYSNTTGSFNSAFGERALFYNTTGQFNTAIGQSALFNSTGNRNTALGQSVLFANTTGADNTAVGQFALGNNITGSNNVALGQSTFSGVTSGQYSTGIGQGANVTNGGLNYVTAIGAGARVSTNNTLVLGALAANKNSAVSTTDDQVVIGATGRNDTQLNTKLFVNGAVNIADKLFVNGVEVIAGAGTNASNINSGLLATTYGGTGVNGSAAANGQLLIGNGTGYTLANITGTANQINVVNGAGSIALSLPQNIATTSTPTFGGMILNGGLSGTTGMFTGAVTASRLNVGTLQGVIYTNTIIGLNAIEGVQSGFGSNVAVGQSAMRYNTSGAYNVGVGLNALLSNTTGNYNSALGETALSSNTTGSSNVAIGQAAMFANTTGSGNTAVGVRSLQANTTGYSNAALGERSLQANTTGYSNAALGARALEFTDGGYNNSGVGNLALRTNSGGFNNSALGAEADVTSANLSFATAIGSNAKVATSNTLALGRNSAVDQVVIGTDSRNNTYANTKLYVNGLTFLNGDLQVAGTLTVNGSPVGSANKTGIDTALGFGTGNLTLGTNSMAVTSAGSRNTALGQSALSGGAALNGTDNTAVGFGALQSLTNSNGFNVAIGAYALNSSTNVNRSVAIGYEALRFNSNSDNIAIGSSASRNNNSGTRNLAIGTGALFTNTNQSDMLAIGYQALYGGGTVNASGAVALGNYALRSITDGSGSVAIGNEALRATTTGTNNVALGRSAGYADSAGSATNANTSGNHNTFIGSFARPGTTTQLTYATALGANALVSTNNTLALGRAATDQVVIGSASRNDTHASTRFYVQGNAFINGALVVNSLNLTGGLQASRLDVGNSAGGVSIPNVIVGLGAMPDAQSGIGGNTVVGAYALLANTSGSYNSTLGEASMQNNSTGFSNSAFGSWALRYNTTGAGNSAFGNDVMLNNTTGGYNAALGYNALIDNTTGSQNTGLGSGANVASGALNYATVIGADAVVSTSNTMVLGRAATDQVVIGATARNDTETNTVLYVNGTTRINGRLYATDSYTTARLQINTGISSGLHFGSNAENLDTTSIYRANVASDQTHLRVRLSDNNQGFGTAFSDEFQIGYQDSGYTATFRVAGSGAVISSSSITATAFNTSSDRRLKSNLLAQDPDSVLSKLSSLSAYSYDYLGQQDLGRRIGVIAQDMLPLFPEAVSIRPDGFYAVDYGALGALAAAGVGRLNNRVLELDKAFQESGAAQTVARIDTLEGTVKEHDQRIGGLESWKTATDKKLAETDGRIGVLESWKTSAIEKMDGMQTAIDLNIQKIADNAVAIQANTMAIERLDDALIALDGRVKSNSDLINNINARWNQNFNTSADGSVLTVNAVELKVSNFTAQKLRASSVYSQRLEAEMARIVELEVNNLRANSAVANSVQAEQVNTGSAQVYAGVGMPAVLFSAKSDGHYTVNTSALDGSYATATVIVNAGQAKVIGGQNEGIELYAEGNTIKALAAGKSIKASWIKTG